MNKKITYMYPYLGAGRVAIAIRYTPGFEGNQYAELAFAFCSPNDQFVRAKGRQMVTERLDGSTLVLMPIGPNDHLKEHAMKILYKMRDEGLCPKWAAPERVCDCFECGK